MSEIEITIQADGNIEVKGHVVGLPFIVDTYKRPVEDKPISGISDFLGAMEK